MGGFKPKQFERLPPEAMGGFKPEQFAELPPEAMGGLSRTCCAEFT